MKIAATKVSKSIQNTTTKPSNTRLKPPLAPSTESERIKEKTNEKEKNSDKEKNSEKEKNNEKDKNS